MPEKSTSQNGLRAVGCLALICCLSLSYLAGFGTYRLWEGQRQPAGRAQTATARDRMPVYWEAWDHVETSFYGNLPESKDITYAAIAETLTLLNDPYTIFVEPLPRELERDHMRGTFGGIGVDLWYDTEGSMRLTPYPDSPAAEAGVLEGDTLLAVDEQSITQDTTIDEVRAHLHGEVDTTVTLMLSRAKPGQDSPTPPFDVTITRAVIEVPSVTWRVLDQSPTIGYIHIQGFTDRTDEETIDALQALRGEKQIASLVLDLRNNYGGLLAPAVTVASQFLEEGVVVYERGKDADESSRPVKPGGVALDIPLAVLVNVNTASASEIVAGALQDYQRAVLIGDRTYGKGSVQLIYDLSDGSSLHVTSAVWLTPNGHRIEGVGLTPDILVPQTAEAQDTQLDRAVEHLLNSQ
jgi:carboxyl-terminal processing protease